MKRLIIFAILSLLIMSCDKDPIVPVEKEPIPEKGIPVYVPAGKWSWYFDHGKGQGYKNGNKFAFTPSTWELPEKPGSYSVFITTFVGKDSVFLKEVMGGFLPDKTGRIDNFDASYQIMEDDDVASRDKYLLDTTHPHWINIEVLDQANNIIKGQMEAHFFLIDTVNKHDPVNPNHVHFTNLKFETKFKM